MVDSNGSNPNEPKSKRPRSAKQQANDERLRGLWAARKASVGAAEPNGSSPSVVPPTPPAPSDRPPQRPKNPPKSSKLVTDTDRPEGAAAKRPVSKPAARVSGNGKKNDAVGAPKKPAAPERTWHFGDTADWVE